MDQGTPLTTFQNYLKREMDLLVDFDRARWWMRSFAIVFLCATLFLTFRFFWMDSGAKPETPIMLAISFVLCCIATFRWRLFNYKVTKTQQSTRLMFDQGGRTGPLPDCLANHTAFKEGLL